jgi:lysylphosphatidylglycerol synthetase-like protein (DUF2156 family)
MRNLILFSQLLDGSKDSFPRPDISTSPETIINTLLAIFGAIAVLIVVYSGIQMIVSSGNSDKVATARKSIIAAIAGLVVISLSWVIVNFVAKRLGA